jgi:DNA (cytosine-5)-methyltransferase 1
MKVAALFAGIGGLDIGLEEQGHETVMFAEWDPVAQAVLRRHFPDVPIRGDIRNIKSLPKVDIITGGFPCQDISFIGTRTGLGGEKSGMVWEMFRLVAKHKPKLILMENVSNLLRLQKGAAMRAIIAELEKLGYRWAYRLVDSRGFGLPQRRLRVVIVASRTDIEPAAVLFSRQREPKFDDSIVDTENRSLYGFYWTEGRRGVGWAKDAVPTIKGGSGLGIPSPPAIYNPKSGWTGTPTLTDAERLQGFDPGWTDIEMPSQQVRAGDRWKMLGNAVSVPLSSWIAQELSREPTGEPELPGLVFNGGPLPTSAKGESGRWEKVLCSTHVNVSEHVPIGKFLQDPLKDLSPRAIAGYVNRVERGDKKLPSNFIRDLKSQLYELS